MIQTVEAVVDGQGRVRLLGPVQVDGLRRALVTILDEAAEVPGEAALLAEAALAGILVLVGWWRDVATLKSVLPGLPRMVPNTALGLTLAGIALWLLRREPAPRLRRWFAEAAAGGAAVIGLLTLAEYLLGRDLGIDQLLARDLGATSPAALPGRPPVHTALALVLVGLALGGLDVRPRRGPQPAQLLAVLSTLVALLALLGYACGVPTFYGRFSFWPHTGMALHTALLVTLLGAGIVCARPGGLMAILLSPGAGGVVARRLLLVPVALPLAVSLLQQAIRRFVPYNLEFGGWLFSLSNVIVFTLVIWWVADVLHRADAGRAHAEQRFRAVAETAIAGIVSADSTGHIIYLNPAAEQMFGYAAAEAVGRPLTLLMPERFRDAHAWGLARFLATGESRVIGKTVELAGRRKDGAEFPLDLSLATWRVGPDAFFTGIVHDISARKRAEEELRRLNQQLEAANQELKAFSYSVSHDLRAPLRAIDGFARILLEDCAPQLTAEAQRYLQRVRYNTLQMGRLVDDLLALSRLGRQPLAKQPVAPAGLVKQVLDELHDEQANRRVAVTIAELPVCLADPGLLKQVWANLLANALKYTRGRDEARIEVGCRTDGGQGPVYFVRDNGVGFDMQYAHKLFGVFQRLHRAEEYEGTGVGLAIVQRIVHRHGGRVWADARPGEGATFYFTLQGAPGD